MKFCWLALTFALSTLMSAHLSAQTHHPEMYCHRTANQDVPENTRESLELAARLGCDVVEIDVRRTLDGVLVLNHDGLLERLTNGIGDIDSTFSTELDQLDAGDWMASRFHGLHIARLAEALRIARERNVRLILDIKVKGIGPEVIRQVREERMWDHVYFNGEWDDVRALDPTACDVGKNAIWVGTVVKPVDTAAARKQGKLLIANFSANDRQMDIAAMKAAVAAGADAINVDYPLLGAEAVGRPVLDTIAKLVSRAESGVDNERVVAILELGKYYDPSLIPYFVHWLASDSWEVSRASALALLPMRPLITPARVAGLIKSRHSNARRSAAWMLGELQAPAPLIAPLLNDRNPQVARAALLAISKASRPTGNLPLRQFLESPDVSLRGPAALAMAHTSPTSSMPLILAQLKREMSSDREIEKSYIASDRKVISADQIRMVQASFRNQMQMLRALASIHSPSSTRALQSLAFGPTTEFTQMTGAIAGYQLWDRAAFDPQAFINQLNSSDKTLADRAEWILIKAGAGVLPALRARLELPAHRARVIHILAWQSDGDSIPALEKIAHTAGPDQELAAWAVVEISARPPVFATD